MHGGFTEVKPWLPVAMEHLRMAVNVQEADPDSMLAFYRRMLAFREVAPGAGQGQLRASTRPPRASCPTCARKAGDAVFCAFNLGAEPVRIGLPAGDWRMIDGTGVRAEIEGARRELPPHQALFAERG